MISAVVETSKKRDASEAADDDWLDEPLSDVAPAATNSPTLPRNSLAVAQPANSGTLSFVRLLVRTGVCPGCLTLSNSSLTLVRNFRDFRQMFGIWQHFLDRQAQIVKRKRQRDIFLFLHVSNILINS